MFPLRELCVTIVGFTVLTSVSCFGVDQLLFVFYESPTVFSKHNLEQLDAVFENPKYDLSAPNVLYVHGYQDSPYTAQSQLVIEAYLKKGEVNVFALDWSTLADGPYAKAVVNAMEPGCPAGISLIRSDNDLCSHRRAILLWAESVSTDSPTFTATMFGNPSITTQMGFNSSQTTIPGKYVLQTNSASPFSQG